MAAADGSPADVPPAAWLAAVRPASDTWLRFTLPRPLPLPWTACRVSLGMREVTGGQWKQGVDVDGVYLDAWPVGARAGEGVAAGEMLAEMQRATEQPAWLRGLVPLGHQVVAGLLGPGVQMLPGPVVGAFEPAPGGEQVVAEGAPAGEGAREGEGGEDAPGGAPAPAEACIVQ